MEQNNLNNIEQDKTTEDKVDSKVEDSGISNTSTDTTTPTIQEVKEPQDRHEVKDPTIKDTEKYYKEGIGGQPILIPASTCNKLIDFINKVGSIPEGDIDTVLTEDQLYASIFNSNSLRYSVKDDVYVDNLNKALDNYVNRINFGDKKLNISKLGVDTRKKLSPSETSLAFRNFMSVGQAVQVPLWHSGFWISLKPPTQTDIVNLQIALANSEIELGRETSTLIYSNYGVVFHRIISDFLLKQIDFVTVDVKNEDIRKYISIHDYYPLVLGLISAIHPKGITVTKGCINTVKTNKENQPLCDFLVTAKLDPKKLVWVDRTQLTDKMLAHMSNRTEHSVSLDAVKEYRKYIDRLLDKEVEIENENGNKFSLTYSLPNLYDYILNGERWVNNIIKKAEALYSETDTIDQKNIKINELNMASILGVYNVFVKKIRFTLGETELSETDLEGITDMLSTLSTDDKAFDQFITNIEKFIGNSAIAIVATPSYTCPNCKKHQTEGKEGPFKEFIPLNIVEHFFVLCTLRIDRTRQRQL